MRSRTHSLFLSACFHDVHACSVANLISGRHSSVTSHHLVYGHLCTCISFESHFADESGSCAPVGRPMDCEMSYLCVQNAPRGLSSASCPRMLSACVACAVSLVLRQLPHMQSLHHCCMTALLGDSLLAHGRQCIEATPPWQRRLCSMLQISIAKACFKLFHGAHRTTAWLHSQCSSQGVTASCPGGATETRGDHAVRCCIVAWVLLFLACTS